jgi:hypothetical protein
MKIKLGDFNKNIGKKDTLKPATEYECLNEIIMMMGLE